MEYKQDKSSSRKNILIIILIIAVLILIALVIAMAVKNNNGNEVPTAEPTATATWIILETPTPTPDTDPFSTPTPTPEEEATAEPTQEPTTEPTDAPTEAPEKTAEKVTPTPTSAPTIEPTPTPTATPAAENVFATGVDVSEGTAMDYSFLEGVSSDYFHDCNKNDFYTSGKYSGKLMGSWWCGEWRDSNKVIVSRHRSTETEAYLTKYNSCYIDKNSGKTIYLTFDCGYENGQTAKILDTLKEKNVKAIFFVTAQFLAESNAKELCERMIEEGHLIGNHTYNHPNMALTSNDEFVSELKKNEEKLSLLLGYKYTMTFYRPPEGASSERDLALAIKLGYRTVFWSFAYYDYNTSNQMDTTKALNEYLNANLHEGAVYLLHAVSSTNATILGDFIDYAKDQGYTFARIDEYPKTAE